MFPFHRRPTISDLNRIPDQTIGHYIYIKMSPGSDVSPADEYRTRRRTALRIADYQKRECITLD